MGLLLGIELNAHCKSVPANCYASHSLLFPVATTFHRYIDKRLMLDKSLLHRDKFSVHIVILIPVTVLWVINVGKL
jgi:hypothetical protein